VAIELFGAASIPADDGSSNATQQTITPPASMTAGDLVFVTCSARDAAGTFSIGVDGGQSWSTLTAQTNTNLATQSFWCRFDGTWDADPRFDFSTATCNTSVMLVFRPTDTAKLWDVDQAQSITTFAAAATITITGQTRAQASAISIAHWVTNDDNQWGNLSGTGWTKTGISAQYRNNAGNDSSQTFAWNIGTGASNDVSQDQTEVGNDAGVRSIISFYEYSASTTIAVGAGAITSGGYAPTLVQTANQWISPAVGTSAITGYAPTLSETEPSITISVGAGSGTFDGKTPALAQTENQWITPDTGEGSFEGAAPALAQTENQWITPDVGEVGSDGYVPTAAVTENQWIDVDVGSGSFTGHTPAALSGDSQVIEIGAGSGTFEGYAPSLVETEPETESEYQETPAGRGGGRRRRYYVEIDGQEFVVNSVAEAVALLDRAAVLAETAAQKSAERVVEEALRKARRVGKVAGVELKPPTIRVAPELRDALSASQRAIEQAYKDAAIAAEIQALMAFEAELDDEDILLLM
jgi:hypothetical protein